MLVHCECVPCPSLNDGLMASCVADNSKILRDATQRGLLERTGRGGKGHAFKYLLTEKGQAQVSELRWVVGKGRCNPLLGCPPAADITRSSISDSQALPMPACDAGRMLNHPVKMQTDYGSGSTAWTVSSLKCRLHMPLHRRVCT